MAHEYTKQPFIMLSSMRNAYDRKMIDENREDLQSPEWQNADGDQITDNSLCSDVYVTADGTAGFFYSAREKGGHSIYQVLYATFVVFIVSAPKQFADPADAQEVCIMLARGKTDATALQESAAKGKGRNAAAVVLYMRNRTRSDSLVNYRKTMRDRQIPLKKEKQWEKFAKLIDDGELTADALQQAVYYARDVEAARRGESAEGLPPKWSAGVGRSLYIAAAVEGKV